MFRQLTFVSQHANPGLGFCRCTLNTCWHCALPSHWRGITLHGPSSLRLTRFFGFGFTCFPTGCLRTLALQGTFQYLQFILFCWWISNIWSGLVCAVDLSWSNSPFYLLSLHLHFNLIDFDLDFLFWNFAKLYREEAFHPVDAGDSALLHTPCEQRHFLPILRGAGSDDKEL